MVFSLSGNWRYSLDDNPDFAQPGFDDSAWSTMHIPQNWFLGGLDHHGVAWFRCTFEHQPKDGYVTLHFDGVDYFADAYLNGQFLGHHSGYFEPFQFDVTHVLQSGENILAVRVDSPYEIPGPDGWDAHKKLIKGVLNHHDCRPGGGGSAGQSYNTGGIWNRVYLEDHGPVTIEQVFLRAKLEGKTPILHVEMTVRNRGGRQATVLEVRCAPDNFPGEEQTACFPLELPGGKSAHSARMPIRDLHLWQPWDRGFPHLYNISTTLENAEDSVSKSTLFGFRAVKVEEGFHWAVNGQPYFVRGSNYIGTQWLSEALFPDVATSKGHPFGGGAAGDFYARDVALARQANLNMLRVHGHVIPPEFHEACDRAGMLVWQDFPLQWGYADDPEFLAEAKRQMRAMLTLLYNHPSIAAWCCHNESPWSDPGMTGADEIHHSDQNRELDDQLGQITHKLDPERYLHRNSGNGDAHIYPGWYAGHWRDFLEVATAPFITEYGAQGLPNRKSLLRTFSQLGQDAGYAELLRFKAWLESYNRVSPVTKFQANAGFALARIVRKLPASKRAYEALLAWASRRRQMTERSLYQDLPSSQETPADLQHAHQVWQAWRFHNIQFKETFENGIQPGASLDEFIANSQAYQAHLIQFGTECLRRARDRITGIIQFHFTDPWPAVTWSVLDYWRDPKPAFDALGRSMQPVLPSFLIPEQFEERKAALLSFHVVNDLLQAYPEAICEWRLEGATGDIASATFPVDIPANGISAETKLTLTSLGAGKYKLFVEVTSDGKVLGKNYYEINVESAE